MTFAPKPGCPMCGIVDAASHSQINSPSSNPTQKNKPDVLWKDDNLTVYRETANPVSSLAHIIVAFKSACQSHCKYAAANVFLWQPSRSVYIRVGELRRDLSGGLSLARVYTTK